MREHCELIEGVTNYSILVVEYQQKMRYLHPDTIMVRVSSTKQTQYR